MAYAGLCDKVAVITGASKGIGRAVAERLAEEQMRLVLTSRHGDALEAAARACAERHAEAATICNDVGSPTAAEEICDLALARFGRLDVLINCAGVVVEAPLGLMADDEVQGLVATNVLGVTWMTRAALKPMLKQRSGVIINFSSVLASRPGRGNAVYAGTKGYVEAFTRAMAAELGRKHIRVNAIAPGVIETAMSRPVMNLAGAAILERIGLKRMGTAREVAAVAAFLASDEAAYIHGAVIPVDGAFLGPA
jgi:3-oxoacyl-[acyl-carrier protein] reductase